MNEIKYEPLYGLQKPFDNGPADSTAYGLFRDGGEYIYYKIDKTSVYCFDTDNQWSHIDGAPTIPFLAMRRIIAEPKLWTCEDQKAGRLPEVGCRIYVPIMFEEQNVIYSSEKVIVSVSDNGGAVTRTEVASINLIKPIETPEEKAARLRKEWCNKALSSCSILSGMQKYELKRFGGYIEDIYDALLSGDLSTPVQAKDGE